MSGPIAVDFSFQRPSVASLRAANVVVVLRYLTGSGKALTKPELATYLDAGIGVGLVAEGGTNDIAGGFSGGAARAAAAVKARDALGLAETPIYFAVDEPVTNPDASIAYFEGVGSEMPAPIVGDYAEGLVCEKLSALGLAAFHWQTESTGFPGNASTLAITDLQQRYNASPVPGTDLNIICKLDVGQYPRPAPIVPAVVVPSTIWTPEGEKPLTQDEFFYEMRRNWYLLRHDLPSGADFNAYWYAFHVSTAQKGFGGSMDLVLAQIHDSAGPGVLR